VRQAGRGALEHDEAASEGGPYFFLSSVLCRTGCCCIGCTRWGGEASGVSGARLRVARSTLAQISAVLAESCAVSSAKKRRSSSDTLRRAQDRGAMVGTGVQGVLQDYEVVVVAE